MLDVAGSSDELKVGCSVSDTLRYVIRTWDVEGLLVGRVINFPNPFSSLSSAYENQTTIRYELTGQASWGLLRIFNAVGELVYYDDLEQADLSAGEHLISWNGWSVYEQPLASGVYFGLLEVEGDGRHEWGKWKVAISNRSKHRESRTGADEETEE